MTVAKTDISAMPKRIILNTSAAIDAFRDWLKKKSYRLETTAENHAGGLFSFIHDSDNARESVSGYLADIEDEIGDKLTQKEMFDLLCELEELGRCIWAELVLWNVFSKSGTNWYYYDGMMNDDMVIVLADPESIDESEDDS